MKNKQTPRSKGSSSKPKTRETVKPKTGRLLQMTGKASSKKVVIQDPAFTQAVQNYQEGLRALQERKFERAKGLFQKVVSSGSKELGDRAAVHLNTCNQHLEQASTSFKTPEEHYDYAVSLMNLGDYVSAREHLEKILKQAPKADYACYGMAVLDCLTGHYENSLKYLSDAIRLNPANRYQARNDTDFRNMADDPRFTELLYPESGAELNLPTPPGVRR
jgi:tetratricopeptide (TPR) repeat protein